MKCLDCSAPACWKGRCKRCYARAWYHTPKGQALHSKHYPTKQEMLAGFTSAFNCTPIQLAGYILSLRAAR